VSSIQLVNTYPEDERWMEAGADAFALHIAACCYSDRMDKDGLIPKTMVARVAIMVDPSKVESAVESLVDTGFWSSAGKNFRINRYLEDKIGLAAEEKISTRNRWANSKRIRRQHNNGNHSECPPKTCKLAEVSTVDSTRDSTGESTSMSAGSPASTTLPVTTRHYSTPGGGRVVEGRGAGPAMPSAGAPGSAYPSTGNGLEPSPGTPSRRMPNGWTVTAEMMGGADPNTLTQDEIENRMAVYLDGVEGLVSPAAS
jgi:hypothetical protein